MTDKERARLTFHGATVMFVGLLCGFPALAEWAGEPVRAWRSAHLGLIATGIWLLASGAVLPSLVLGRREASALVWSLIATAHGLMVTLLVQAVTGVRGIAPTGPAANWAAFAGNVVAVLGALLATLLTLLGARAGLKAVRAA